MGKEWKKYFQIVLTGFVILFIFMFTILNIGLAIEPTRELINKKITFSLLEVIVIVTLIFGS